MFEDETLFGADWANDTYVLPRDLPAIQVSPDEMGRIAGRFAALVTGAVAPPVRVVKFIGDAVMLMSWEPAALLRTLLRLVEVVDGDADELPPLHGGAAHGPAVSRAGDWFGHAVNLASRITAVARPGTILADGALRRAAGDGFVWTRLSPRHLRGVEGHTVLHRLRGTGEDRAAEGPDYDGAGRPAGRRSRR